MPRQNKKYMYFICWLIFNKPQPNLYRQGTLVLVPRVKRGSASAVCAFPYMQLNFEYVVQFLFCLYTRLKDLDPMKIINC